MSEFNTLLSLGLFPLFQGATPEEAAKWVSHATMRTYQPGEYLLQEGTPNDTIHFVTKGKVRLLIDQKETMVLDGVSTVGVFAALSQADSGQGAIALEETTSLELPARLLLSEMEDRFTLLRDMLSALFSLVLRGRKNMGPDAGFPKELEPQPEFIPARLGAVERLLALASMGPLKATGIDAVAKMANELVEVRYPAGHVLWEQGDSGDFSVCIIGGVVECSSEDQSYRLGPNDFVGSLDAWAKVSRTYKAVVIEDLVALQLPVLTILDAFEDHFDLANNIIKMLSGTILEFQRKGLM